MTTARMLSPEQIAVELCVSRATAGRIHAHAGRPMSPRGLARWIRDGGLSDMPSPADDRRVERATWRAARVGQVYYVEARGADRIKIGFTAGRDPVDRVRSIQTSCPFPLVILASHAGSMQTEQDLHRRFASERIMACAEWFHASLELRWHIEGVPR